MGLGGGQKNSLYFYNVSGVILLEIHVKKMSLLSLPNLKWHLNSLFLYVREALR